MAEKNYWQRMYDLEIDTCCLSFVEEKITAMREIGESDSVIMTHLLYETNYLRVVKDNLEQIVKKAKRRGISRTSISNCLHEIRSYLVTNVNDKTIEKREANSLCRAELAKAVMYTFSLNELTKLAFPQIDIDQLPQPKED